MKFSDINPFTKDGDYEVNIGLKYLESTLKDYEEDYGLELNPDFQRGAVWTEEQQVAYVEFFLRGGKTARVIYFNCPSFDRNTSENNSPMVCVDGLQRLTALRKFLNNELKVFGSYLNDFEDKEIMLRSIGQLRFNVNNLKTRKEVLQWYLDFNTGGTVHSQEEINRVKELLENEN
ncbi:DUF262 domain-containing protein [Clostridium botulinum]|uniref:DUF262 domain-containing protein n=1 Tax=Clostridium botulinum TaxID=1491 RepID=UPI001375E703|nr:DUF262 domain-containing protein [Clostridium botulinum]NCI19748.1 DUF262 domain-containing protein [Clostridium botulinum]NCI35786.1 DUF262 domain-containing protein [Clostridium botulinum]NCI71643.1 DUF262 domain-containing protein [Clostridium botulinum]NDI38835.1 DUF262 domain-containing protein [Clostridium botulinum]